MLIASTKFQDKAEEVLKEGLEKKPTLQIVRKRHNGGGSSENVELQSIQNNSSGMMLYTSGTTSRPVSRIGKTIFILVVD